MMSSGDRTESSSAVPLDPPWNPWAVFVNPTAPLSDALVWDLNPQRGSRGFDLGRTAINAQLDLGDVAAVIGGQEHGDIGELVWPAHPAHRYGGDETHLGLPGLRTRRTGIFLAPGQTAVPRGVRLPQSS